MYKLKKFLQILYTIMTTERILTFHKATVSLEMPRRRQTATSHYRLEQNEL